jgi:hypothetical protein
MFNLNATLDNLIAMVVVLLALSLVVQAVQSAVKKMFRLKSRQIEDSLAHLIQFTLHDRTAAGQEPGGRVRWLKKMFMQSPFLRIFSTVAHPAQRGGSDAAVLFGEVVGKFKDIGRTAITARPIFDSLSKSDLMKVVSSIAPEKVDKDFPGKFKKAVDEFKKLSNTFLAWEEFFNGPNFRGAILSPDDKAKLADLHAKFRPLVSNLRLLLTRGTSTGQELQLLAKDVVQLRAINLNDVQKLFDDVRANVASSAGRERLNGNNAVADDLTRLASELAPLSDAFAEFRRMYDEAFAKWAKLEESFDAVMQSFEERYTRSMKTAAIIISFLVVVFLNANFFGVYRSISTSDAQRELIIQSRPQVIEALRARAQTAPTPSATPNPNETEADRAARLKREQEAQDAAAEQTVQSWFKASQKEINDSASIFIGYGFEPITWTDTKRWLGYLFVPWQAAVDSEGKPLPRSRWESGDWWKDWKLALKTLLGWVIMALLLSVGAPFWQDFLESLFGIKNVLRKRSDTKNIEQEPGTGQPRQA